MALTTLHRVVRDCFFLCTYEILHFTHLQEDYTFQKNPVSEHYIVRVEGNLIIRALKLGFVGLNLSLDSHVLLTYRLDTSTEADENKDIRGSIQVHLRT